MSEARHDLHALFPDEGPILHALKVEDARFRDLADRHHAIEVEIQRLDAGLGAASDERLEELKKQRLRLLDEVMAMIAARKVE
ncbi:DUF465 domain-containing protein [Sphingopyxis granuli]|uniref:YdcH family protein n=1 Tax=Sphingopyxis granuli TaxID=267128 RepID=UPI001F53B782|nr:DUF465 domain-containing protein [Sphingopyxis granuli]UNK78676.1 DUF465 domain-containing protein [Sphingopyxis granuli]